MLLCARSDCPSPRSAQIPDRGQDLFHGGFKGRCIDRLLANHRGAKRDLRLPQDLAKLAKYAGVILDDIGYLQNDRDEMEVLFTFLSERSVRKSVLISTYLIFSVWERFFKHPMTTMAAIDCVIHHCVILEMMAVDSYHTYQATKQQLPQREKATIGVNT